jgi:hypothetical protein
LHGDISTSGGARSARSAAQPLGLLIISSSVAGMMMCFYSALLIVINRRHLPRAVRIRSYRLAAMVWATLAFGALAAFTIRQQISILLQGGAP